MRRMGLVVLALLASTASALAQNRTWVPWGDVGSKPYGGSSQASTKQQGANRQGRRANDADSAYFSSANSWGQFSGQAPYQKSTVQYPAVLDGGGKPSISPQAPQTVAAPAGYGAGSIVIDTSARALYYVLSSGGAYRYPISVGRDGFRWKGTEKISRVASWPDWHPPEEMRERDPKLPEVMTGGIRNPLGAKALYLGNSLYRIHGTNDAKSIGYAASSGCFRMMNHHVLHLATVAGPGTTVHVLDRLPTSVAEVAKGKAKKQG